MDPEKPILDLQIGHFEGPKSSFQVPHFDTLFTENWLVTDEFSTNFGFKTGSGCSQSVLCDRNT